jgi:NNP family nitrate/nitrite transporter-like MFS transporter
VTGALADRFGGRLMFSLLCLASIPPVLLVVIAGNHTSYPLLLVSGFFLGIAGTTFAVGIPFVSAWFDPARRGFATGLFGAGMGGTALSAFFTPRFVTWFGYTQTHLLVAAAVAVVGLVSWTMMADSPRWTANREPVVPKLVAALRLPVTWAMSFLYAVTFGGFVAFATYLPTYLKDVYQFDLTQAGTRTAGFALAAVVARPIGGVLADRVHPRPVVLTSLAGAAALALVVATQPAPELAAGLSFVAMAFLLGIGMGGVFAWVARRAPADRVGSVAGIVGAAGGLGGFFPPLVMGATYNEADHSYTTGLVLLCMTAAVALAFVLLRLPREQLRAR